MTFRRRILAIVFLPLILLAVVTVLYLWAESVIATASRNHELARQLTSETLKLSFLTDRYLLYRQVGMYDQWLKRYGGFGKFLKTVRGEDREEDILLSGMSANLTKMRNLLEMLLKASEKGERDPLAAELENRLVEAVLLKSRSVYSDAMRLEGKSNETLASLRRKTLRAAFAGTAALTLAAMLIMLRLSRRTLGAVDALREGTERVAAGDYDIALPVEGNDELARLAASFNVMSEQMKKTILYMENSIKALEIESRLSHEAEEEARKESEIRLRAEEDLQRLNRELEDRVHERTEEVRKANDLLRKMKEHADRETYQARMQAQLHQFHLRRMERLIGETKRIFACGSVEAILGEVAAVGREIVEARYCVIGHRVMEGSLAVTALSAESGSRACPPGGVLAVERGGVYLDVLLRGARVRMTDDELRKQPEWWGLPPLHVPLRGLLGVPIYGAEAQIVGMMMVTDRLDGNEFSWEDETILAQVATLASMAIQCVDLRECVLHPSPPDAQ